MTVGNPKPSLPRSLECPFRREVQQTYKCHAA
jgi:hypothetical protein